MFSLLGNKQYGFIASGILIFLSLIFLLTPGFRLSMGIDFTGGTAIIWGFNTDQTPNIESIESIYRSTLGDDIGANASSLQNSPEVIVKSHILSPEDQEKLLQAFQEQGFNPIIEGVSTVGSSLGEYFQSQALLTIAIAIISIILFLAWAFRSVPKGISSWKFGLSAIIALVHDVIIIAGVFAFLGQFIVLEVDTLFVTALLTVLGFSVHDTIVVFDRIRENLVGKKSENIESIAESSLWQTMGRSLHTSISTLFVLVAVLLWGAPSLFAFIFALCAGILIGTYSSIFVATPVLVLWIQQDLKKITTSEESENDEEHEYGEGFDQYGRSI